MFVLSLVLLILSFKKKSGEHFTEPVAGPEVTSKQERVQGNVNVFLIFLSMGVYLYLMPILGFIGTTIGFLFACQAILMGLKGKKVIIQNMSVSIFTPIIVYFIFNNLLRVLLP